MLSIQHYHPTGVTSEFLTEATQKYQEFCSIPESLLTERKRYELEVFVAFSWMVKFLVQNGATESERRLAMQKFFEYVQTHNWVNEEGWPFVAHRLREWVSARQQSGFGVVRYPEDVTEDVIFAWDKLSSPLLHGLQDSRVELFRVGYWLGGQFLQLGCPVGEVNTRVKTLLVTLVGVHSYPELWERGEELLVTYHPTYQRAPSFRIENPLEWLEVIVTPRGQAV